MFYLFSFSFKDFLKENIIDVSLIAIAALCIILFILIGVIAAKRSKNDFDVCDDSTKASKKSNKSKKADYDTVNADVNESDQIPDHQINEKSEIYEVPKSNDFKSENAIKQVESIQQVTSETNYYVSNQTTDKKPDEAKTDNHNNLVATDNLVKNEFAAVSVVQDTNITTLPTAIVETADAVIVTTTTIVSSPTQEENQEDLSADTTNSDIETSAPATDIAPTQTKKVATKAASTQTKKAAAKSASVAKTKTGTTKTAKNTLASNASGASTSKKTTKPNVYRVVFDDENREWLVKKDGVKRIVRRLKTKDEAVKLAKEISENNNAKLFIHKKDGKFQKQ